MSNYSIGCEFGSTRIKSVLINDKFEVEAIGIFDWENILDNGLWSYKEETILKGLKECFASLKDDYTNKYNKEFPIVDSVGFSAMMHGYIALDKDDNLLVPFRTWRNTNTGEAASILSKLFDFNIPMRWSIAHLYQAILNKEKHVKDIAYLTTLEGYIHYKLTGQKVLGVGEASGMFPIDSQTLTYDKDKLRLFNDILKAEKLPWKLEDILPSILNAGEVAGKLTEKGKTLLGDFPIQVGTKFCPPEGDAETGMMATNSITPGTGNVSAGTSVFAMIVLKDKLKHAYPEIDVVATPHGKNVAMVHSNTCSTDINHWMNLFSELFKEFGYDVPNDLYSKLFSEALNADEDVGKLTNYNFFGGEPVVKVNNGQPVFSRDPDGKLTLANFMRCQIFSSLSSLAIGLKILEKEGIKIDKMFGHGGLFKSKEVSARYMSCAMKCPISIFQTASEGGPWGIALLASYLNHKDKTLEEFTSMVFKNAESSTYEAKEEDKKSFEKYLERYLKYLPIQQKL